MRHLSTLIFMLFISCAGKADEPKTGFFSNREFSLDTVIIDAGDEIIFLKYQLLSADISKDRRYLLNFNEHDHTVEKIDLDEFRLEAKLPFEREGPNGTGSSVGDMRVQNENQITLLGMDNITLFSLDGKKLKTVNFETFSLVGNPVQGGEYLGRVRGLNADADRLYGIIYNYDDKRHAFGIINL